ncbi:MAG: hypothetical protein ACXAD7_26845 [Candidatus Kariarchaeaceae archaeon]|jgi:hypothetical protein
MGIFDFFKRFGETKEKTQTTKQAIESVKRAAQASNYNQASIQAFYALEEIGRQMAHIEREISITAREYSQILVDSGNITTEELEPIIYNFEVARYSPEEVTFEAYQNVEATLESLPKKFKTTTVKRTKGKAKDAKKRRKKRPKRRATGARRRRERD